VDRRCDDVASLAAAVRTHLDCGFGTGVVIGNPIPAANELPQEVCDRAISAALADAAAQGVQGRDVTPFLLERMRVLTEGQSVTVNQSLLVNNAVVAADLAVELARQR
jgi:pseudouridine-5'-phosphate glycosidase